MENILKSRVDDDSERVSAGGGFEDDTFRHLLAEKRII